MYTIHYITLSSTVVSLIKFPHKLALFSICQRLFFRSYLSIVHHNHKLVAFISIRVFFFCVCFSTTGTMVSSVFV